MPSVHICTSARCHHTVHSRGGAPLFTTTIHITRALTSLSGPASAWQLKGLVSGRPPAGNRLCPHRWGLGGLTDHHSVMQRGLGCEERGRGRFCKKTLLCKRKSTVESSLPHFLEKPDSAPGDRPHLCLLRSPMQSLVLRAALG